MPKFIHSFIFTVWASALWPVWILNVTTKTCREPTGRTTPGDVELPTHLSTCTVSLLSFTVHNNACAEFENGCLHILSAESGKLLCTLTESDDMSLFRPVSLFHDVTHSWEVNPGPIFDFNSEQSELQTTHLTMSVTWMEMLISFVLLLTNMCVQSSITASHEKVTKRYLQNLLWVTQKPRNQDVNCGSVWAQTGNMRELLLLISASESE